MIALDRQSDVPRRLREVHRSCPEMRLGQLLATVAMLGEDSTGRFLWNIAETTAGARGWYRRALKARRLRFNRDRQPCQQ
jgi:hypothetical protein